MQVQRCRSIKIQTEKKTTSSESLSPEVISESGFQYGKFANNLFSILKQLVTVPKMGKIHHI